MKEKTDLRLRPALAAAALLSVGALSYAPLVFASDTDITSASAKTCALSGSVKITVLGNATTYPLPCVNQAQRSSPGIDEKELVGTTTLGVPSMLNVATVSAPHGLSEYDDLPNVTKVIGDTELDQASFAQGMVSTTGVRGRMECTSTAGSNAFKCAAGMAIAQLNINGRPVTLPEQPIPFNYEIPIGGSVNVTVLGISLVVPVSGAVTLNGTRDTESSTPYQHIIVEHIPVGLNLHGGINVLGLGGVGIQITLEDHSWLECVDTQISQNPVPNDPPSCRGFPRSRLPSEEWPPF